METFRLFLVLGWWYRAGSWWNHIFKSDYKQKIEMERDMKFFGTNLVKISSIET